MNFLKKFLISIVVAIALYAPPSLGVASGIPTIDAAAIIKLQEQLVEAKLQLREQIEQNLKLDAQTVKLIEQVKVLEEVLQAVKDGFTLEDLGIDPAAFLKDILPDFSDLTASVDAARAGDWSKVLKSGMVGSATVESRVDKTFENVGMKRSEVDALANSEDGSKSRIGTQANMSVFISVAAESSSEAAKESLVRIDKLMQTDTDNLKQALDKNTAVTAELGIGIANMWALMAVQTVGQGEMGVMDAATAAEEEKYLKVLLEEDAP